MMLTLCEAPTHETRRRGGGGGGGGEEWGIVMERLDFEPYLILFINVLRVL